jgi:hypothetical protein
MYKLHLTVLKGLRKEKEKKKFYEKEISLSILCNSPISLKIVKNHSYK